MDITLFARTAYERHRIYILKKYGAKKPWTGDSIFQKYRFCCTFRELDKTTEYIITNIINPNNDDPNLWQYIIIARYISQINTLKELQIGVGFGIPKSTNLLDTYNYLRQMQVDNRKIVTNAFVCNSGIGNGQWVDKVSYIFMLLKYIRKAKTENVPIDMDSVTSIESSLSAMNNGTLNLDHWLQNAYSLETMYHFLIQYPGVGNFMAYQYLCDFKYSTRYLNNTTDDKTWTSLGIGAIRGIRRLLYNNPKSGIVLITDIMDVYHSWITYINDTIEDEIHNMILICKERGLGIKKLEMYDLYAPFLNIELCHVEHWLCEYDKYCRGGSKKRRYYGTNSLE